MFDDEPADALGRIDRWEEAIRRRAEQAQALARRTEGLSATARSRDRLVEVTVGREGQIEDLRLAEGIRHQPAATTAREILATLRLAKADLVRQFDEATAATVGVDTETGRALMQSVRNRLGPVDDQQPADPSGGQ
ncbi:YbaB/EbfC family nucleoid-associated protein [Pseudosporangium ferrugineum]|uniref:YbaB/EbfC DNA-binding family protein n=1 Tax=Pseudosporangium ferrugineum TaxID=439699 RepID=A0A2T0RXA2_9ACTN|nr:YbaB/EbfC family nucleoid-associated protein [Pseudosporangium ferrugineum]PRY25815.1 hypothetical protein CLV70_112181 [Pseudosporangium ferrugineum]